MKFEVTILGSSSATPIFNRNPTSQILNINERLLMIDCGEGTQQQMLRYGIKHSKIDHIFISHLHGDHFFGLIGLISSMNLNGRIKKLKLFGPENLLEILNIQLKYSDTRLCFELDFFPLNPATSEIIYETPDFTVQTLSLNHRVACNGFIFREKQRLPKIIKEKVEELDIPSAHIPLIKKGFDFVDKKGITHKAEELTTKADKPKSYAYCSDTKVEQSYIENLIDINTLYHEATFLHEMLDRATETHHTTALQAAEVAKKINTEKLLIGHFSARYRDLNPLLEEAKSVFNETYLATEGETFVI